MFVLLNVFTHASSVFLIYTAKIFNLKKKIEIYKYTCNRLPNAA